MRAIVFPERGRATVAELPDPSDCGPTQILTRAVHTGLTNGTERNILLGGNYSPGHWPVEGWSGYQHVGRVIEVGAAVDGLAVGDVVYSDTPHREINVAEAGVGARTIRLPDGVDLRHAALFGVASVAMHTVLRADLEQGEKALVVGAGLIGQLTAQLANIRGADVWVCDVDAGRLEIAAALGAAPIKVTAEETSWSAVREAGPFNVVFEDSGAPVLDCIFGRGFPGQVLPEQNPRIDGVTPLAALDSKVDGPRSRVVMVAGRDRVSYDLNAAQSHEIDVLHVNHFDVDDLRDVVGLVAGRKLLLGPLIKDDVKVADAPHLYARLAESPGTLLGTVFDWR